MLMWASRVLHPPPFLSLKSALAVAVNKAQGARCAPSTKEPHAYTHTADSTGRFRTARFESTADARDAAAADATAAASLMFALPWDSSPLGMRRLHSLMVT